jgi:hypothetical protein
MDNVAFQKSKVVKEALSAQNLTAMYSTILTRIPTILTRIQPGGDG